MITINYGGSHQGVADAVAAANGLFSNPEFYNQIRTHNAFDMADCSPGQVADLMHAASFEMTIVFYTPPFLFSRAYAFDDIAHPFIIHLNKLRLGRPLAELAATIMHECVHALDATSEFSFGHGDNTSVGKDNTAPYWIDQLAARLLTPAWPPPRRLPSRTCPLPMPWPPPTQLLAMYRQHRRYKRPSAFRKAPPADWRPPTQIWLGQAKNWMRAARNNNIAAGNRASRAKVCRGTHGNRASRPMNRLVAGEV